MTEKFMIYATISYLVVVFASAAIAAYWPQRQSGHRVRPARLAFYISLLQWFAILSFLILSHSFIYDLAQPLSLFELLQPSRYSFSVATVCLVLIALNSVRAQPKRHTEMRNWWSPLPLVLAISSSWWLSMTIAQTLGTPPLAWPDWRFVSVSLVMYLATLVLCDMFISLSARLSSMEWHETVAETTRLCALLPALLVFLFGLDIQ